MAGSKRFTPTVKQLQALIDLPSPTISQCLIEERAYLREALAAVEHEINELVAVGAPVEPKEDRCKPSR